MSILRVCFTSSKSCCKSGLGSNNALGRGWPSFLPASRPSPKQPATQPTRSWRAPKAQSPASEVMACTSALAKVRLPLFAILAAVLLYNHGPDCFLTTIKSIILPAADHTPISPHSASWKSWYHPLQSRSSHGTKPLNKDWNILHHLGGNGPWVEKLDEGGTTPDLAPPPGCSIDQVHMVGDSDDLYRLQNTG